MSTVTTTRYQVDCDALSQRQAEVLGWLAEGKTLADIALITGIHKGTVQRYSEDMRAKLKAATIAEAVAHGFATGIITVLPPEAA